MLDLDLQHTTKHMKPMEPPDCHYLNAAQGWLELADEASAQEELAKVTPQGRAHPLFLMIRWQMCAKARHWEAACMIAQYLVHRYPEEPLGWLQRSFCLHTLKRTPEAFQQLLPAAQYFPNLHTVPYHLACYACQLGHIQEAWHWLDKAIAAGNADEVKSMALDDPMLAPLWQHLRDF